MTAVVSPSRTNPYVGPSPFGPDDTLYGRDGEVGRLLDVLMAERIVLLYSPSGAGKTSLIQAGLRPRLREEGFVSLPPTRVNRLDPDWPEGTNRYMLSVLASLEQDTPSAVQLPLDELAGMDLEQYLQRRHRADGESDDVVLIFDQFEELLTLDPTDGAAKKEFLAQVGAALRDRSRWALFAMREEHIAGLEPYRNVVPTRLASTFRLDLLSEDAARTAITAPAESMGVTFSEEAAVKLVDDLRQVWVQRPEGPQRERGPHIEPVQLQVVCRGLWERLPEGAREIGTSDLEQFGDVDDALADYYDEQLAKAAAATGSNERVIRDWVERDLITQAFRAQVRGGPEVPSGDAVVRLLEDAYLVRGEDRHGTTWYELAHDRLIDPVRQANERWREENLSPLQKQARLWHGQRRGDGLLLRGDALEQAGEWAAAHGDSLTSTDREFLEASRTAAEREARDRRNATRIRTLAIVAVVLLAGAAIAAIWAILSARDARRSADLSKAQELLIAADADRGADPTLSLLLTRAAADKLGSSSRPQQTAARGALYQAVFHQPERLITTLAERRNRDAEFSPDGKLVVTAGNDGNARVWEVARAEEVTSTKRERAAPVNDVAYRPDRTAFATAGEDGFARVWDVKTGRQLSQFPPPGSPDAGRDLSRLNAVAFSPDGARLVTANAAGQTAVWEVASAKLAVPVITYPVSPPAGYPVGVRDVDVAPDGKVATANEDGKAIVWDPATGEALNRLDAGRSMTADESDKPVNAVAFSLDGTKLATAAESGRASVWELASDRELLVLSGHRSGVNDIAFGDDDKRLATAGDDGTASVWDATTGRRAFTVAGGARNMESATLSPDGARLLTTSTDGATTLWDGSGGHTKGHTAFISGVSFSPDGKRLATASADGTATVWDWEKNSELRVLTGHAGEVNDVVFSPDGTRLATAGDDRTAKVWDVELGSQLLSLSGHADFVRAVAFTPDGNRLATASADQLVKIWDLDRGTEITPPPLSPHQGQLFDLAISPDGSRLATAGADGTAKLWDLTSGTEIRTLAGHKDSVRAVSFSPDGTRLATAGNDEVSRLWDVNTGAPLDPLSGEGHAVRDVAFHPDGIRVALAGNDGIARIWTPGSAEPPRVLEGHAGSLLGIAFSRDGAQLATTSGDKTAKVWNPDTGGVVVTLEGTQAEHTAAVKGAQVSAGGTRLVTGSADGTAKIWEVDPETHRVGDLLFTLAGHQGAVNAVALRPDGRLAATASDDGTARLWNVKTGEQRHPLEGGHKGAVNAVAFRPDGRLVATAGDDGTARLWNVKTGEHLRPLEGHKGAVNAVAFSPDGRRVVTAGEDRTVRLWEAASGKQIPFAAGVPDLRGSRLPFSSVAFSPDGEFVATTALDGTVEVWTVSTGKPVPPLSNDDPVALHDVAFSSDGRQLAAAGANGVLVWDLETNQAPMRIRQGAAVDSVAFSADGEYLVAAGGGNRFYLYPLDRGTLVKMAEDRRVRALSEAECERFFDGSCGD